MDRRGYKRCAAIRRDTTGLAREIHVLQGLGTGLDEKAVEAVNAWKFRPRARDGKAVAVQATVQVDFRLRDQWAPTWPRAHYRAC